MAHTKFINFREFKMKKTVFLLLCLFSFVFGAQKEAPNTELQNYKIEQLQKTIDELKKDLDETKKSQQSIESLKDRLGDANSRIDNISSSVDRFGIMLSVLLIIGGFVTYISVRTKAKEEARESAKKETEEWINKEAQTTLQSIIDKLEKEAQEKITKAVETAKEEIKNQSKAEELFMQGNSYLYAKEYDKAVETYQKSLAINPNNDMVYINMGAAYGSQEKYDKAIDACQKAIKLNPNNNMAYESIGVSYSKQGKYNEAIVEYQKSITINPDKDSVYINMGVVYANQGKDEEAIEAFQKAIEINPQKYNAYINLFELQLRHNQSFNDEKRFIALFQEEKTAMIIYEMLKILQCITLTSEYTLSKEAWASKYQGMKYNWGWNEIETWLSGMEESETKTRLIEAIAFFKEALKA